jgi:hypothetical protein
MAVPEEHTIPELGPQPRETHAEHRGDQRYQEQRDLRVGEREARQSVHGDLLL